MQFHNDTPAGGSRAISPDGSLEPGTIFGGYRIVRLLGAGGMGVVYEAVQLSLDRPVALKLLAAGLARDPQARQRFVQEGRLAARVTHPNLVTVLEVAEVAGRLLLAHELVLGETVQHRLEREGRLPIDLALEVAVATAGVLTTLHAAGVLHRDLKPGNLFLSRDRGVLVGDLGIAKDQLSGGLQTHSGMLLGTPLYMAPEVWAGRPVTAAADLYALGIVLFECLAGRPPFESDDPVELSRLHAHSPVPSLTRVRPELPPDFDSLLGSALAKSPSDRFPDASAFESALGSLPPVRAGSGVHRRSPAPLAGPRAGSSTRLATAGKRMGSAQRATARFTAGAPPPARWPLRTLAFIAGGVLTLLAVGLALRPAADPGVPGPAIPVARPAPAVPGVPTAPRARPAPDKPAAWLVSPTLPGDETTPGLAAAQQALRDTREEVNRVHSGLRKEPAQMSLADALRKTVALWKGPLESCRLALEELRGPIRRREPGAAERAARLLAGIQLLFCEVQDCFGCTGTRWAGWAEDRGDVTAEFRAGVEFLHLKDALAAAALPLHEAVRPILPEIDAAAWRGGVACLMTMVDGALPRGQTRPAPSELVRQSLMELAAAPEGMALLLLRSLARAARQVADAGTAVKMIDDALAILEKPRPSPEPARELARFDLCWQRNWALHELNSSPVVEAAGDTRRKLERWTEMRARLILSWPFDPRDPEPPARPAGPGALAFALNPDVKARLADVDGWIENACRDLRIPRPPEPKR